MAITAIMGTTLAGTWALREHSGAGAAIAAALQPAGRAVAVLEQQRQQLIIMDAAAHTMRLVGSPKVASRPTPAAASPVFFPPPDPGSAQSIAYNMMSSFGFDPKTQFGCLDNIWSRESGWRYNAENASGAYGIPQALPGDKMAIAGSDWQTNPATQIKWGLGYIKSKYGTPCNAWAFWQAHSYY
jgi:hypothetical protein